MFSESESSKRKKKLEEEMIRLKNGGYGPAVEGYKPHRSGYPDAVAKEGYNPVATEGYSTEMTGYHGLSEEEIQELLKKMEEAKSGEEKEEGSEEEKVA